MTQSWRAATFAPFKSRIFLAIWAATLVSSFGSLIQAVGASWLMTSIAPSADMVALVQASTALPILLLSLPAGAVADTASHRVIMLVAQGIMLTVSVALAAIVYLGHVTPWVLLSSTFLLGCGAALYGPAWQASVAEQVKRENIPAAVSLNSLAYNIARTVGPAIGGLIVATAGPHAAFAANAVSYIGLIVVLVTWRHTPPAQSLPPESMGMAMQAGLRYVLLSPAIRAVLVRGFFFGLMGSAIWALMPLIARDLLAGGAATYGFLFGAFGIGAVTASLLTTALRSRLSSHAIITLASIGFGIATIAIGLTSWLSVALALLFITGFCWLLTLSTLNITVQISSPRWVVGRALATYQMATFGALAAGSWLFGAIARDYDLRTSLIVAGAAMIGCAALVHQWKLPRTAGQKLDPLRATLAPPQVSAEVVPQSGPVVVSVEYRIAMEDRDAFMIAMREMRRIRRRNGAQRWTLLQDVDDLTHWTERFQSPTWLEYLRQRQRLTVGEGEVAAKVRGFHRGEEPPRMKHHIERTPTASAHTKSEADRIRERASMVDPYLPPISLPGNRDADPTAT